MDPLLLLRAVREVSILVNPEQPTTIPQRAFDAVRQQSAVPNLPRAKRIVAQLNARRLTERLTWGRVLVLAHMSQPDQMRSISTQEISAQTWLTDQQVAFALQLVARRLKTSGFSSEQYASALRLMRDEDIPVDQLRLPSNHQIIRALARKLQQRQSAFPARVRANQQRSKKARAASTSVKSVKVKRVAISKENAWKAALEMAGLSKPERDHLPPLTVSTSELLERCYATHGTQLTRDEARTFAKANNVAYSEKHQKLTWGESVAQWKKDLETRGIVPPQGPPRRKRPDYARNVGGGSPRETLRTGWSDIDACLVDVCSYLKQLPAGERSTHAGFQHWIRAQGRKPPAHDAFRKHGGWNRVRQLAHERIYPGLKPENETHRQKGRQAAAKTPAKTSPPKLPLALRLSIRTRPKKRRTRGATPAR